MESGSYKEYRIFGHVIHQQEDILSPERYAGSGTITRDTKIVEATGVLGVFDTEERSAACGVGLGARLCRHPRIVLCSRQTGLRIHFTLVASVLRATVCRITHPAQTIFVSFHKINAPQNLSKVAAGCTAS